MFNPREDVPFPVKPETFQGARLTRRIHTILLCLALLFVANPVGAESPGGKLKQLRKRYDRVKTLRADFKEIFRWELTGETTVREGSLLVTGDDRFRVDTPEQLLVCDGKTIYRLNRPKNQVIIEGVEGAGDRVLPNRLLLGFAEQFKAVELEAMEVAGQPGFRLELTAEDPETVLLRRAVVWATAADLTVRRLMLVDLNDNTTTYRLSGIVVDRPVGEADTAFSVPEGAEVFDLR